MFFNGIKYPSTQFVQFISSLLHNNEATVITCIQDAEAKYGIILKTFFKNLISSIKKKNIMNLNFHN